MGVEEVVWRKEHSKTPGKNNKDIQDPKVRMFPFKDENHFFKLEEVFSLAILRKDRGQLDLLHR